MTPKEYKQQVLRTESPAPLDHHVESRLLHAAMGMSTEAGEILDVLKKNIFYHKPIDTINIKEEIGDILWYLNIVLDRYGWSLEEVMDLNISKLRKRYPEQFTDEDAVNRDLDGERKILEGDSSDSNKS